MIGLGTTANGLSNEVEIIDLGSTSTTCHSLPNFPVSGTKSIGGLSTNSKPIICGGLDIGRRGVIEECNAYANQTWETFPPMIVSRYYAAASPSPYPNDNHNFLVTGGC